MTCSGKSSRASASESDARPPQQPDGKTLFPFLRLFIVAAL